MSKLILLNKPYRVLPQFTDSRGRSTLADFIAERDVYPAGRLDYESEGLIVLTDDGALKHRIAHPRHKLTKVYYVQVEGAVADEAVERLRRGVDLNDGPTRPAQVRIISEPPLWPRQPPVRERRHIPTTWLELALTEGRNRQVRRMTAAVGHPTLRLIRVRVGDWSLDGLQPGEYRTLTVHAPQPARRRVKGRSRRV